MASTADKSVRHERQFQLVGAHPALDLVNTLDWRFRASGAEELLASYDDVLLFLRQSAMLSEDEAGEIARLTSRKQGEAMLALCIALREAAAQVLYATIDGRPPDNRFILELQKLFQKARTNQDLVWDNSGMRWEWTRDRRPVELPLWLLSRSVEELLTSDAMKRLRACENSECRWLFLDTSKNHTRRWCDMKLCGNRMKARRFKAQHKG